MKAVHYRLEIKPEARQQLRALAKEHRRNIGWRSEALQTDLAGNVKKLTARTHEYRLRAGDFRVLFMLEGDQISVYAVKDRKEASALLTRVVNETLSLDNSTLNSSMCLKS